MLGQVIKKQWSQVELKQYEFSMKVSHDVDSPIAERYMGLGYGAEAEKKFAQLKDTCRRVSGCFTLLWHNSHFSSQNDRNMYEKVIS